MPDLLGYDRRTKSSAYANLVLGSLLSEGVRQSYNRGLESVRSGLKEFGKAGNSSVVPASVARKMSYRRRRYGRRRSRYGKKRYGFKRSLVGKRRGTRYVGKYRKKGSKLDINFNKNDYETLRVVAKVGDLQVDDVASLTNNTRYVCHLDHWTTEWASVIEEFAEFKFKNIQFVLEPQFRVRGATFLTTVNGDPPYLGLRTVNTAGTVDTNITSQQLRQTPGVRMIPILREKRTVHNVAAAVNRVDSMKNDGTSSAYLDHVRMPWVEVNASTKAYDYGAIEIRKPQVDAANSSDNLVYKYNVMCYATIMLRGRKGGEIIAPYV